MSKADHAKRREILGNMENHLLDWAETLLCNAVPMPHCSQQEWDAVVKKWRDEKHRITTRP